MMKHYDVLIATPGTKLDAGYVKSLTETLAELSSRGITYKWLNGQSSLVHNAREVTVTGDRRLDPNDIAPLHGEVTYNKIFWIDSDIEWTTSDFFNLYNSDLDIVSGAYLLSDGMSTTVHTEQFPGGIPKEVIFKMNKPAEVDAVGFGFIAVKQGVFENIDRPWFGHLSQYIANSRGQQIPTTLGEDISWCIKAKQKGYKIYFDPKILVTHIKTVRVTW